MLPWAASTPVSREEKEKEKEKRSLGAFSVLDIKIRSQIWHYATLGFPIPIHDVDWTPAPEPMDPPSLLDNIKDSFQSLAILHSQPHIQFPILLASHMIKDEAIDELYDHNYSITFTMSPTMDPGCLYSDLQNPAFIGDIHSPHSQKCRLDYSDIQKTDFARFARVTFIIRGPDAKKRDWSTSKPEAIDSIIRKAIVPSKLQRLQRSLKELVVSFENQEGWVWTRKENLRQFNNDFKQMCYGLDGYTTQLTEENARGTLEQVRRLLFPILAPFMCVHSWIGIRTDFEIPLNFLIVSASRRC